MTRSRVLLPAVLVAGTILGACAARPQEQATLFRAARIYTMEQDSLHTGTPAVGVRDGRVVAVGDSAAVARALARGGTTFRVDMRFARAVLVPGFVEAHSHMQGYGLFAAPADSAPVPYAGYWDWRAADGSLLRAVPTVDSLKSVLRRAVAARPDTTVPVVAYGTDPIYFGGKRLSAAILDSASATRPIMVLLNSGHIAVVNTPMLRRLQANPSIWSNLLADRRTLVRDPRGQPTGEIDEVRGTNAARSVLLADTAQATAFQDALLNAAALMRAAGVTTATDLYFGMGGDSTERNSRRAYEAAAASDPVFPRVYLGYGADLLRSSYGDTAAAYLDGVRAKDAGKVRTGPVKVIVDGSIQGYTAVLSTPYADAPAPGANPIWNTLPDSLHALLLPYWRRGFRVAAHLNGDSSTLAMIRAVRALQASHPWPDHRTAFEHNQSAFEAQYDSIRALGATVNLFPGHVYFWGPQHRKYTLGPARAADIAAARWAVERGLPFSLHSDAPVTQAGPLFLVWAAVNRLMPDGTVLGPSQRITVGQAMRAVTWGGAYLLGAESEIGTIRPGKLADFTALEEDPFAVAPERICAVRVVGTVTGGVAWTPRVPQGQCPSRPGGDGEPGR